MHMDHMHNVTHIHVHLHVHCSVYNTYTHKCTKYTCIHVHVYVYDVHGVFWSTNNYTIIIIGPTLCGMVQKLTCEMREYCK